MLRSIHSENPSDTAWDAPPRNFRVQKKDQSYVWVEMRLCTDVRVLYAGRLAAACIFARCLSTFLQALWTEGPPLAAGGVFVHSPA